AEVTANRLLSRDYNVLALHAPAIAAKTAPGQFVMVKVGAGSDPLLRRPFSVFEVLRDDRGTATGISLLNKRIGVSTTAVYEARTGAHVACLGPLGQAFSLVYSATAAWLVVVGVCLARFATFATVLPGRGVRC